MDLPRWWPFEKPYEFGDSIELMHELPPRSVDLIFTSPPYHNQRKYDSGDFVNKKSGVCASKDSVSFRDYMTMIKKIMKGCYRIIKDGGIIAWNVGGDRERDLRAYHSIMLERVGFQYQDMIIWAKRSGVGIRVKNIKNKKKYYPGFGHEPVYIYRKGDVMKNTMDPETAHDLRGWQLTNVWPIRQERSINDLGHPAPFPVELAEMVIKCYSKKSDVVFDPFLGSGTTIVASKRLDRIGLGFELKEEYKGVIRKRTLDNVKRVDEYIKRR